MSVYEALEMSMNSTNEAATTSSRIDEIEQQIARAVDDIFGPDDAELLVSNRETASPDTENHESITADKEEITTSLQEENQSLQEDAEDHETETKWQRRRRRIAYGLGAVASAAVAIGAVYAYTRYGVPTSHGATYTMTPSVLSNGTDIYVGGHTDTTSHGVDGMLQNSLQKHGNKDLINYPAEMAPLPGDSKTWNESTAIGGQKVVESAMQSGDPNNTHIIGFSEGSQAALNGANKLHEMGYNPELTLIGTPDAGGTGFFEDSKVKALKPVFDAVGVDITKNDLPSGTTVYGKPGDIWVNGGNRPIQTQIGQALGTAFGGTHGYGPHEINNPENTSFVGSDGVTYITVKDDLSGYGHAAKANGLAWSPQAEAFVDAVAPEGKVGQPSPGIDSNNVLQTGADLVTDSINRALPADSPKIPAITIPDIVPAPVADTSPAPVIESAPAPVVPEYVPEPVQEVVQQVIPDNPAPAAPAPAEVVPQVQNTIDQVSTQVQEAVGGANTPAGQAVGDVAKQANDFVNSLLPR